MKKLLCFLLAFSMLFTSLAASAAISVDKIPEFLDKTGIVEAGTFADETKVLTRGEFAKLISNLVVINNYKNLSEVQVFKDIPMDSELFDVTTLLNQLYFIVGDGNGYFEPEAPITAEAACKILVHLMGDQYFAQYYGGYIPAAASKGILNGVELSEGQTITAKAAMKLIYNLMVADISNSNLYDGNATDNAPEEMFMSKRLGIYQIEGKITDDSFTGLTGVTEIDEGYIKIGQYTFRNETGLTDILGYTVEGFYKYDEEKDENVLIYAYINEKQTDVLEIADENIINYANYTYEYYVDEFQSEDEEAYLNTNYKIIYNGHAYTRDTIESTFTKTVDQMLKPENGWVRLVDTDGDGYYDLVIIKSYEVVVLSSVDVANQVIYGDPEFTDIIVDLGGVKENIIIKDSEGFGYELSTLDRGDVLSIAESADGKYAEIMYSVKTIEGTLGSTDGDYYYIGEGEYRGTKSFNDYVATLAGTGNGIAPGTYGTFYFTFDDKIASFRSAAEKSIKIGLVGKVHFKSGMDDILSTLILTETNSFDTLNVAAKVNLDGVVVRDLHQVETALRANIGRLIRYKLNKDNEINWIDTPYLFDNGNPNSATEPHDSLFIMKGGERQGSQWNSYGASFYGDFMMNSSVIPFVYIPTEKFEESYATTFAEWGTTGARILTPYSTDIDSLFVDYVVFEDTAPDANVFTATPTTAVVLKISDAVNEDGDLLKKLVVTTSARTFDEVYAEPEALTCKCGKGICENTPLTVGVGDIFQYALADGIITSTILCYDYSEKAYLTPGSSTYFGTMSSGKFEGEGHGFTKAWIDEIGEKGGYSYGTPKIVLPVNYINRIEGVGAQFAFDFWPFANSITYTGIWSGYIGSPTSAETLKAFSTAELYVIKVNVGKGTATPLRIGDLKTYNDGAGVKEQSYAIWSGGKPTVLVLYK